MGKVPWGGRAERSGKMQREENARGGNSESRGEKRKGARAASPQERLSFPDGRASFFLRVRGEKSMAGIKLGMRCVLPLMCAAKAMGGCGLSLLCAVKLRKVSSRHANGPVFFCAACLERCRGFAMGSSCAVRNPEKVCRLSDCVIFARDSSGRGLHALSSEIFPAVSPNGRKD